MVQTKLADLVASPVFADAVREKMVNKIAFMPMAFQQNFSNEQVGKIFVPKYGYVGDAKVKPEGEAIVPVKLTQTTEELTINTYAQAFDLTDEAKRGGVGDPVAEAEDQLATSVANAIDNAIAEALKGATLTSNANALDATGFFTAQSKFGENQDEERTLYVNAADAISIQTDKAFVDGKYYGANVFITNKVDAGTAYLVRNGGLGVYLAQDVEVEHGRDPLRKTEVIVGSAMAAVHVRDESKVVKITVGTAA